MASFEFIIDNKKFILEVDKDNIRKPLLKLTADKTPKHLDFLTKLKQERIDTWGTTLATLIENDTSYELTITGKMVIIKLVFHFMKLSEFEFECNRPSRNTLLLYQNSLRFATPETLPKKSKQKSSYQFKEKFSKPGVKLVTKKKLSAANNILFYKKSKKKTIETEALASSYYQLMMGYERAAKVRSVYKDKTRKGVISPEILGFKPGATLSNMSDDQLIDAGIAEMLVASYLFAEADLNMNNWGMNSKGKIVRVDFAESFWPLTSKYAGFPPYAYSEWEKKTLHPPISAFPITTRDLSNFPWLQDTKPPQWQTEFNRLSKNPRFVAQKWKYFLKAILLNEISMTNLAKVHLGSLHSQDKYSKFMNDRIKEVKKSLLALEEFCDYVKQHPNLIKEICAEFTDYNAHVKEKNQDLRIDIEVVNSSYKNILVEINKKHKASNNDNSVSTGNFNIFNTGMNALREHSVEGPPPLYLISAYSWLPKR